jgi:PAS domain S-box-containing protein
MLHFQLGENVMIKDFISNAALMIASFTVMGQIFRNRPLQESSPFSTKLHWGLCYGVLGNILMIFSIQINHDVIADLRYLAIVIPAAFGGLVPALISTFVIAIGRLFLFGVSDTSLIAASGTILTGIVCGGISKLALNSTFKAFFMNVVSLIILSFVFGIILDNRTDLSKILMMHYPFSLIGGVLAYHFSVFIANSNASQTKLKLSHLKLKESEERFRLLAEYSSDMITMHNEHSEYIYISPAVEEIIKFEYQELLGKKIEHFIHPDDILHTNKIFNKALKEGFADSTYRYRTKKGDYIWIESTLKSVCFQEDGSKRVIIVSRNITERKLTEQKLQKANELLNRLSYMDGLTGIANRRYFDAISTVM